MRNSFFVLGGILIGLIIGNCTKDRLVANEAAEPNTFGISVNTFKSGDWTQLTDTTAQVTLNAGQIVNLLSFQNDTAYQKSNWRFLETQNILQFPSAVFEKFAADSLSLFGTVIITRYDSIQVFSLSPI